MFVSDIADDMERVPHGGPTGPGDPVGPYPGVSTGVHIAPRVSTGVHIAPGGSAGVNIAPGGSPGANIVNMEAQGSFPPRETITGNECHVCG